MINTNVHTGCKTASITRSVVLHIADLKDQSIKCRIRSNIIDPRFNKIPSFTFPTFDCVCMCVCGSKHIFLKIQIFPLAVAYIYW